MKSLGALATVYASGTQTTAILLKVTRPDGVVLGFTSHDKNLPYGGVTYLAAGVSPSAVDSNSSFAVANLEGILLIDNALITEADLIAGKYNGSAIDVMRVDWASATVDDCLLYGHVGEVRVEQGRFVGEAFSLVKKLQNAVGQTITRDCPADLGDARCKVDVPAITVAGTVTTANGQIGFTDSTRAEAAGLFQYGKAYFTSGANTGLGMEVQTHSTGGVFVLRMPMPYPISPGDAYTVYPGCDKAKATCKTKFNNIPNFRGFSFLVGTDGLLQRP